MRRNLGDATRGAPALRFQTGVCVTGAVHLQLFNSSMVLVLGLGLA